MSGIAGRAAPARERLAADRAVIQISRPIHKRLLAMKYEQQEQLRRQVSFTEIIEQLLNRAGAA